MKYSIDFSIFDSPTHAYGNVTGEIDFPHTPEIGHRVVLLNDLEQRVASLGAVQGVDGVLLVGLEDIVFDSRLEAAVFAKYMESSLGLFCVVYDEF
ncbi:hypothetical protein PO883_33170 [Massilia sp. DJPM01]|uniref:hypothetical protein n=1 Tax=Massilia sp. DJPM01 TaxID=3024404 RepID=UPI00259E14E7|nr:hypothetical protein [Massilia sp. DJPM01]MDM5182027.1 hypothetical protein [Massilia sp. DJPM01]